jgi:hypothetical protein
MLPEDVYLENRRSAVQLITTSKTNPAALICMMITVILSTLRGTEQLEQPAIFVLSQQLYTVGHNAVTGCENASDLRRKKCQGL